MANFGDFKGAYDKMITLLKEIARHTKCQSCGGESITSAGANTSVPAGFKSISIAKTSVGGVTNITLSDGSIYPMTEQFEVFVEATINNGVLPAYPISGGEWKWHGIK